LIVDAKVGLVTQVAKKYSVALDKTYRGHGGFNNIGTILTLSDLIQEGNLGFALLHMPFIGLGRGY